MNLFFRSLRVGGPRRGKGSPEGVAAGEKGSRFEGLELKVRRVETILRRAGTVRRRPGGERVDHLSAKWQGGAGVVLLRVVVGLSGMLRVVAQLPAFGFQLPVMCENERPYDDPK